MTMNVDKNVIRTLRLQKSWSQEKLAEISGLNLRTVQRIEKDGIASLQSCASLAKAFDVDPMEFALEIEFQGQSSQLAFLPVAATFLTYTIALVFWGMSQLAAKFLFVPEFFGNAAAYLYPFVAIMISLLFFNVKSNLRLFSIYGCWCLALSASPGDPLTQLLLVLPLLLIFELCLLVSQRYQVPAYPLSRSA